MKLYVLQRFGMFYDFYDGTWNDNLTACYAPFTINPDAIGDVFAKWDNVEAVQMFTAQMGITTATYRNDMVYT